MISLAANVVRKILLMKSRKVSFEFVVVLFLKEKALTRTSLDGSWLKFGRRSLRRFNETGFASRERILF
ncbi:MAG: hypothetical protein ACTS6A_00395 [Candidatus Hodgkinia cicadicola]